MIAGRWFQALTLGATTLAASNALAKNGEPAVPAYVLQAHTVAVMIDPEAGVSLSDPNANETARDDVESAILKWGRFTTVMGTAQADLVIVVRKGHTHVGEPTVSDPRQNSRVGTAHTAGDGISIGAQHGSQPSLSRGGAQGPPEMGGVRPTKEESSPGDWFEVYEGNKDHPMDAAPGWIYIHKDALHAHNVPAVGEFRKAIEEAEKKASSRSPGHP